MADLKPIVKESFTQYAGAVLQSRALVDVRDCLKPSARQIFYCMYTDKFVHNKNDIKNIEVYGVDPYDNEYFKNSFKKGLIDITK